MMSTYIIAEAGVNHNGSQALALEMIHAAKEMGVDAIKFQLFKASQLVTRKAEQAQYQKTAAKHNSQFEMLQALELPYASFNILYQAAKDAKLDFIITPFDLESLHYIVNDLKLDVIKIGSGDVTNGPLLLEAARSHKRIILSTGMCTLTDIEFALKVLAFGYLSDEQMPTSASFDEAYASIEGQAILKEKVSLLHCTSEYPAPVEEVNLNAMDTMSAAFGLSVGFSDHTQGIEISQAAVAKGALIIEKHFTLDNQLAGPDHSASLNPVDFKAMVKGIRNIEKALGDGRKYPSKSELKNEAVVRRSLVASREISPGEIFSKDNIAIKRPSGGLSPMDYWKLLGKVAQKNYSEDEFIL